MLMRTPERWVRPKRRQPPGFILPRPPMIADKVPAGDGWGHELKHDGFRILAFKDGDTVRLLVPRRPGLVGRVRRNCGGHASAAREAHHDRRRGGGALLRRLARLPPAARRRAGDGLPLRFDLLFLEAQDVRAVELIGRRRMLQKALRRAGEAGSDGPIPATRGAVMPLFLNSHLPLAATLWLATAFGVAALPKPSENEPKAFEVPSGDIFGFTAPTDERHQFRVKFAASF